MNDEYRTMYARYRRVAGKTQEAAAELLGVAVRTLANWEAGVTIPPDDKVARMCDIYNSNTLAVEHLRATTSLARGLLPEVAQLPLAQATVQLLYRMQEFNARHRPEDLLRISSDGRVTPGEEAETMRQIQEELQDIVQAALQLKYAQGAAFPLEL